MYNSNYNQKNEFYTKDVKKFKISDVEIQLKQDLKKIFKSTRTVRDLNPVCIFFKRYEEFLRTGISPWISTLQLYNSFKIHHDDSEKYFKCFVAEWDNIEFNKGNYKQKAQCRTIKSFTPEFVELYMKYKNVEFDKEFYEKYYRSITLFSVKNINKLKEVLNSLKKDRATPTGYSDILRNSDTEPELKKEAATPTGYNDILRRQDEEFEDILNDDFYHSTEKSPFRIYHKFQQISLSDKLEMFKGLYDIDLQQCFGSIAWHILDMKNSQLSFASLLNPKCKNELRQKIKDELGLETLDKAKEQICALFTEEYCTADKLDWYKALHKEIIRRCKKHFNSKVEWKGKEENINTMHKFFTYHEQMTIAKLSEECDVILNMHDGIITTNQPKNDFVEYLDFKFLLSVKEFKNAL